MAEKCKADYVTTQAVDLSQNDRPSLELLAEVAGSCLDVPGEIVEVGVFRGGSALVLSEVFGSRKLWLFDTFTGNTTPGKHDNNHEGSFSCSAERVAKTLDGRNFELVPGDIAETWALLRSKRIAFAHIDCDQEASVAACCKFLWPLCDGTMLFDDYAACGGARLAVDSYGFKCLRKNQRGRVWVTR